MLHLTLSVDEMNFKQFKDMPLIFFPALAKVYLYQKCNLHTDFASQMSRFEAERFCSRIGLIFGLTQSNMAQFLQLSSGGNLFYHTLH
jgi:hypothetical protein